MNEREKEARREKDREKNGKELACVDGYRSADKRGRKHTEIKRKRR